MGTECSCSQIKISKQQEISHDEPIQGVSLSKERTNNNQEHFNDIEKQLKEASTAHIEDNQKKESMIKFATILKLKTQRKKIKKVVQVVLPGNEQENKDAITFIEKQCSDKDEMLLISKTLKNHFILSQLTVEEIRYVVQKMKYCTAKKGDYIFKQGDPSFSYYIILEGKCSVHIDGQLKKYLEFGTSFGDLGIVYNAPRSASIYAQTDCIFAQLSSKNFKKIINDLNSMYEQQNKKVLEQIEFYKKLTQNQKCTLASNCITQTYQAGQIIFNKGDAANALYIVLEGIVTILQKNLDLKAGENVGVNAIIGKVSAIRSNTLIAKTNCKLISLTRDIICKNLGDHINNILLKNLITKILKESDIWEMYTEKQWNEACQKMQLSTFNKGDTILEKNSSIPPLNLWIVLKADARSKVNPKASFYVANSIIEPNKVFKKQEYIFQDNFIVDSEAELVKLQLPLKKIQIIDINHCKPALVSSGSSSGSSDRRCIKLKDIVIIRSLRAGNFGRVFACYHKTTKSKIAIKVMNKESAIVSNALTYIEKQTEMLSSIPDHPFIIKYYETLLYHNLIMIAMELIEGEDLFDSLSAKLPLKLEEIIFFAAQLVLIMEFLHENHIVYRDLKPENVMLNLDGYLTLIDFGTTKKLTIQKRFKTSTIIGTPHYMAPQILLGKGYTFTVDWWSLGVMLYEMATGRLPYGENLEDPFSVYQEIIKSQPVLENGEIDILLQQVIQGLLTKSPHKRMKNGPAELKNKGLFRNLQWEKLLNKDYQGKIFPSKSSYISTEEIEKIMSKKKLNLAIQIFLKGAQQKPNP